MPSLDMTLEELQYTAYAFGVTGHGVEEASLTEAEMAEARAYLKAALENLGQ